MQPGFSTPKQRLRGLVPAYGFRDINKQRLPSHIQPSSSLQGRVGQAGHRGMFTCRYILQAQLLVTQSRTIVYKDVQFLLSPHVRCMFISTSSMCDTGAHGSTRNYGSYGSWSFGATRTNRTFYGKRGEWSFRSARSYRTPRSNRRDNRSNRWSGGERSNGSIGTYGADRSSCRSGGGRTGRNSWPYRASRTRGSSRCERIHGSKWSRRSDRNDWS